MFPSLGQLRSERERSKRDLRFRRMAWVREVIPLLPDHSGVEEDDCISDRCVEDDVEGEEGPVVARR